MISESNVAITSRPARSRNCKASAVQLFILGQLYTSYIRLGFRTNELTANQHYCDSYLATYYQCAIVCPVLGSGLRAARHQAM